MSRRESSDSWEVGRIIHEEAIKILQRDGVDSYNKWSERDRNPIFLRDSQNFSRLGTVHMAELAKKEGWTVNQFLREHLLARAQGQAVRKEIEKNK